MQLVFNMNLEHTFIQFYSRTMLWPFVIKRCTGLQIAIWYKRESSKVKKKKVIKVVGKFDTKYSREKEMVLKCLLWEFVISDLLKWLVLKRWNKKPSTLG